jgi:hypothetical protein
LELIVGDVSAASAAEQALALVAAMTVLQEAGHAVAVSTSFEHAGPAVESVIATVIPHAASTADSPSVRPATSVAQSSAARMTV